MKCLRFLLLGSFAVAFVLGFSWNSLQARIVPILNFNSDLAFIVSENEFTLDDYYDDTISLFSEFDSDYDVDMYLEAEMQLGLLWKGEGLLDIFSFFAIYHIELIGSGFDWSQKIPFKKYNEVITADQVTSNFNEYVLTSIDNAIRGTYLQPYFNYRPDSFYLSNRGSAGFGLSLGGGLDMMLAFYFQSFLSLSDVDNINPIDSYEKVETYTGGIGFFL